jgi:molybdopterin/thiamine biosynthesis adenylyltransferase
MMQYSITFAEKDYKILTEHLFSDATVEQAAYLLCSSSVTLNEFRLLVQKVAPVERADILEQDATGMRIRQRSFLRAMKLADCNQQAFMFVHSHTEGLRHFSPKDDVEEGKLFRTAHNRIPEQTVHGSMIFTDKDNQIGRVWLSDGTQQPIDLVRVVGSQFRFYFRTLTKDVQLRFFDRQILAFGEELQSILGNLRIGIVGAGGTGSAIGEQLIRLGVGSLLIIDDDIFKASNISRVYGSRVIDESIPKVKILERLSADIGLGTQIEIIPKRIYYRSVFSRLKECDLVFGCTDDELGRSILTRMAIYYFIPIFDMGVKIDSEGDGKIRSAQGRVTTLMPSAPCLYCRDRINTERIRAESISYFNPEEGGRLRDDGYIVGLDNEAPAVIPFTSTVASSAIIELIHRLTGCLGDERHSSEVLHLFDLSRVRTNNRMPVEGCFCNNGAVWGKGDKDPLLDMTWPSE